MAARTMVGAMAAAMLLLGGGATAAAAQLPNFPAQAAPTVQRPAAGGRLEGVTLTAEQQGRVSRINAEFRQRMLPLAPKPGTPPAELRVRLDSLMQLQREQVATLRTVLTAEQQVTFDANVARREAAVRERRARGGVGARPTPPGGR